MFDELSSKLTATLKNLAGRGVLTEDAVREGLREIRRILLEADVSFDLTREFLERVQAKAIGVVQLKDVRPGQQLVKIVYDELVALLGEKQAPIAYASVPPTVIMVVGLQGSGKTTTAGKLAKRLKLEQKAPFLVAADVYRPAASEQLATLAQQVQVGVYQEPAQKDVVKLVQAGIVAAQKDRARTVIVDTAGRLQIDEALMEELGRVRDAAKPTNVLLVLDAMTGQEAVNVAQTFFERIAFDGVVLTKLDGDARGGAALSVRAVTGKPIKLVSVGEKLDQLEYFHPDRMASRILGMGDVLTLIEKAEAAVEEDEQAAMEARMRAGIFTFDDFLSAQQMLKKMGPLQGVMKMIPGLGNQLKDVDIDERQLARVEAIVLSMTPQERSKPHLIDGSRRQRIAAGCGQTIQDVNKLLSARKQMEKMMKQMGKGKMPTLPGQMTKTGRR